MLLRLLLPIFLILVSTSESIAQASSCQPVKIAFYVEVALGAKDGVARLYKAEGRAVDPGFVPNRSSISAEQEQANYAKRRKVFVEPILSDLRSRMAEIARSEGFSLFEGLALDQSSSLLAVDPRLNLTSKFILHFNDASFKPGRKPRFEVPALKVAVINFKQLYGSMSGLRGLESVIDLDSYCATGKCKEIYEQLQTFAIEQKYGAIFDSGRDLPYQIRDIACHDATDAFVKYFNLNTVRSS